MNGGWSSTPRTAPALTREQLDEQQRRQKNYDTKTHLYNEIGKMNMKIIEFTSLAAESDEDRSNFYMMRALNVAKDQKVLKDALKVLDV